MPQCSIFVTPRQAKKKVAAAQATIRKIEEAASSAAEAASLGDGQGEGELEALFFSFGGSSPPEEIKGGLS